jgi:hypothetical protein
MMWGFSWELCILVTCHVSVASDAAIILVKFLVLSCFPQNILYVDLLLGNDREISKYTKVLSNGFANKRVSTAEIGYSNRGTVFSVLSLPKCYKQDS